MELREYLNDCFFREVWKSLIFIFSRGAKSYTRSSSETRKQILEVKKSMISQVTIRLVIPLIVIQVIIRIRWTAAH